MWTTWTKNIYEFITVRGEPTHVAFRLDMRLLLHLEILKSLKILRGKKLIIVLIRISFILGKVSIYFSVNYLYLELYPCPLQFKSLDRTEA